MIILGIESTAHTFGVGIIDGKKKKILSNIIDSFTTKEGGMIPRVVADHHVEVCGKVLKAALKKSKLKIKDIDLISFSQGPGIGNTLRVGAFFARSLSLLHKKPLIGINHCIAHLEISSMIYRNIDPVLLYVSGANTQIIAYEGGKYRIFGETLDIGIGNLLDQIAREIKLGFPGGPKIYELSKRSKNYIELPYVVKGMDVSFGGILTNVKQKLKNGAKKSDIAYSLQETVFAMLLEVTERALFHTEKKSLVLGGGVACNKRFQKMAKTMCKDINVKLCIPEKDLLLDNGAMIAWLGYLSHKAGNKTEIKKSEIRPYERTDDVEVNWR